MDIFVYFCNCYRFLKWNLDTLNTNYVLHVSKWGQICLVTIQVGLLTHITFGIEWSFCETIFWTYIEECQPYSIQLYFPL